jgi:hypothetical protein
MAEKLRDLNTGVAAGGNGRSSNYFKIETSYQKF